MSGSDLQFYLTWLKDQLKVQVPTKKYFVVINEYGRKLYKLHKNFVRQITSSNWPLYIIPVELLYPMPKNHNNIMCCDTFTKLVHSNIFSVSTYMKTFHAWHNLSGSVQGCRAGILAACWYSVFHSTIFFKWTGSNFIKRFTAAIYACWL